MLRYFLKILILILAIAALTVLIFPDAITIFEGTETMHFP